MKKQKHTPTQEEIEAEIKALQACKAYAPEFSGFGDNNHAKIDLQIEYLRSEIDMDDDSAWEEFTDDEQGAILAAQAWEEGESDEAPSSGWDVFKPSAKKKAKS